MTAHPRDHRLPVISVMLEEAGDRWNSIEVREQLCSS
jgi:hypothetical protein